MFSIHSFLIYQQSKGRKCWGEYAYIKKWNKNNRDSFVQCFLCSGKNGIHRNCIIVLILHTSLVALYLHLKLALHNMKAEW